MQISLLPPSSVSQEQEEDQLTPEDVQAKMPAGGVAAPADWCAVM